jgi:hypothetical protein
MIYYLVTTTVKPGKTAEYLNIYTKELAPMLIKMVGSWHGYTGNMNQFYTLFVADDLADYQAIRTKMSGNKEYQRTVKISPVIVDGKEPTCYKIPRSTTIA